MAAPHVTAPRWRFSLRFLLLAAALVPVGVYWLALPTIYAQRFSAALSRRDFAAAEALCIDHKRAFPGNWKEHSYFEPRAIVKHLTLADLWAGERRLFVGIAYGDDSGIASASVECTATRHGIEIGMALP
jgi:hypothetical protein